MTRTFLSYYMSVLLIICSLECYITYHVVYLLIGLGNKHNTFLLRTGSVGVVYEQLACFPRELLATAP